MNTLPSCLAACMVLVVGCTCPRAQPEAAAPAPSASPSTGDEAAATSPTARPSEPAALAGVWAEFWSVAGEARTAQHAFAPDGRWSWQAAADTTSGVVRRSGRWILEGDSLQLRVELEVEQASCPTAPCADVAPRRVVREPALVEELVLGACPPNDEARALDARYECRSFDGRVHWRRADVDPSTLVDASP